MRRCAARSSGRSHNRGAELTGFHLGIHVADVTDFEIAIALLGNDIRRKSVPAFHSVDVGQRLRNLYRCERPGT